MTHKEPVLLADVVDMGLEILYVVVDMGIYSLVTCKRDGVFINAIIDCNGNFLELVI
jgi:hypothetical protein